MESWSMKLIIFMKPRILEKLIKVFASVIKV